MQIKHRLVLKHKATGLYLSDTVERESKQLFNAKRFYDEDHLTMWMETSPYSVDPEKYDCITVKMTIEETENNV